MRRVVPVIVAALAVTLGACGGGSGSDSGAGSNAAAPDATGVDAAQLIVASADKATEAKTARISGEVSVEVGGETKTMPLDGALDFRSGAFEFSYDLSQLGLPTEGDAKIRARMIDGAMYMSLGDLVGAGDESLSSMLGDKSWVKLDLKSLGMDSSASSGGLSDANPGATLDALRGAGEVERVGTETLRGVETTHYRATIDPQKALAEAPEELRDRAAKGLDAIGGPLPIDVWIDGDGQARKIAMDVETSDGAVSTTIEYYDFGADVNIAAPPVDDVLDFSDVFGGFRKPAGSPSV
jgi:hypothetical protein